MATTFPGLDSRFITDLSLQDIFRDKDTGLPLRNGTLTFYEDCNRTTPKSVYTLSGGPGSYIYTDIGNVVTLNSAGYATDKIYYFPFDGDPDTTTGLVDLYYVEVKSATGVNQQPREAIPNYFEEVDDDTTNLDNFVPNGQFRANIDVGTITDDTQCIAYGPWYFVRDSGSASVDKVTFNDLQIIDNPEKFPRFECVLQNTTADTNDQNKDIRIRFKDVNKFASDDDKFTFKFSGRSKTGANVTVSVHVIYNLGTGGSPSTRTPQTIKSDTQLTTSYTDVTTSFTFGTNDGLTLGTNNDDYVEIAIRFPRDGAFTAAITDVVLIKGDVSDLKYPYITDEQDSSVYLGGSLPYPDPDGGDKFLPVVLGDCGLIFDDSDVGKIYSTGYDTNKIADNELLCDGSSYVTTDKHNGVPLSRLQSKLFSSGSIVPIWGTGLDFSTAWIFKSSAPSSLYITNNTKGSVTSTADGTGPKDTGFTFRDAHVGDDYDAIAYRNDNDVFIIELVSFGAQNASPSAGTSGFTVSTVQTGTSELKNKVSVTTVGGLIGGEYFDWSNTTTDYRFWYTVDGVGSAPADGGRTLVQVDILGTDGAEAIQGKTKLAINGYQSSLIITNDAASKPLAGGEYFTFSSTSDDYYVWYTVDSAGSDPTPGGTGIQVDLTSADDAAAVASKTEAAIDSYKFAVPDLRGQFLRGVDGGAGVDPDTASRYAFPGIIGGNGDVIGSCQQSANLSHNHAQSYTGQYFTVGGPGSINSGGTPATETSLTLSPSGIKESRPINKYVHYVIKI